jgi:hypothetical protein
MRLGRFWLVELVGEMGGDVGRCGEMWGDLWASVGSVREEIS